MNEENFKKYYKNYLKLLPLWIKILSVFLIIIAVCIYVFVFPYISKNVSDVYPFVSHPKNYDYVLPLKITFYYNGTMFKNANSIECVVQTRLFNDGLKTVINYGELQDSCICLHTNETFRIVFDVVIENKTCIYDFQLRTFLGQDIFDGHFYCSPAFHWIKLDIYSGDYWSGYD